MKKYSALLLSGLVIALLGSISSCSEDEPYVKPKLSFAESSMTVNEIDGTIEIEVVLDKPAAEDFTISYELDGDAYDEIRAEEEDELADFEVVGDYGEIEIEKGEDSGIITLQLFADFIIEGNESIEIEITSVDSDKIEITNDDDIEITLEQEQDGVLVVLEWDETYTDVDMDMLLRAVDLGGNASTGPVVWGSVNGSFVSGESIFIPKSIEDVVFGLSYTYYEGTAEPMNFTATFAEAVDGVFEAEEDRQVFQGTYTLANINEWTNFNTTKVVQTFENIAGVFTNFSEITAPATGSRTISSENATSTFNKTHGGLAEPTNLKLPLKSLKKN
ncbi:MAG TPA: hypothetical protein PLJ60_15605 [Chryseolinea sp.]|nr:hypothetical protein [Flavobacteriales bacterium]HPM31759.1 hypothetical protein [Chryseolinea sp.]